MAAQEQAVEKGRLTLREVEIMHDFGRTNCGIFVALEKMQFTEKFRRVK